MKGVNYNFFMQPLYMFLVKKAAHEEEVVTRYDPDSLAAKLSLIMGGSPAQQVGAELGSIPGQLLGLAAGAGFSYKPGKDIVKAVQDSWNQSLEKIVRQTATKPSALSNILVPEFLKDLENSNIANTARKIGRLPIGKVLGRAGTIGGLLTAGTTLGHALGALTGHLVSKRNDQGVLDDLKDMFN